MTQRRRQAARTLLRSGVPATSAGLAVSGAAAYAFLGFEAHSLGPARYAPLATFWSIVFLVGPGVFGAAETETSRRLAAGLVTGDSRTLVGGRVMGVVAVGAAAVTAATLAFAPELHRLFDRDDLLTLALVVSYATFGIEFVALGIVAGNGKLGAYGTIVGGEGLVRLVLSLVIAGLFGRSLGLIGFAVALAPLIAVVLAVPSLRRSTWRGPDVSFGRLMQSLPALAATSLLGNVIISLGPVLVKALANGPRQEVLAAPFLSALTMVKVPLFLLGAASPVLVPFLSRQVAAGARLDLVRFMRRLILLVGVLGLVFVAVVVFAGPWGLRIFFGRGFVLTRAPLSLLAATVPLLVATILVGAALVALHRETLGVVGWSAGCLTMFSVVAVVHPLVERVALGMLVGSGVALAVSGVALVSSIRRWGNGQAPDERAASRRPGVPA